LFGPHTRHIERPAELLERGGGGFRVADADSLARVLTELLRDRSRARAAGDKARGVADGLRGATARVLLALTRGLA
jgi:3-deoxy-D-manno-octulosonic-acid transferase